MSSEWPDIDREVLDARIHDKLNELAHRVYNLAQPSPTDPDIKNKLADLADEYTPQLLQIYDESASH